MTKNVNKDISKARIDKIRKERGATANKFRMTNAVQ